MNSGRVEFSGLNTKVALLLVCFFAFAHGKSVKRSVLNKNVDFPLKTDDIIRLHGYNAEVHEVKTEDDYYLTLHRITGRSNETRTNATKPVVLLMHGLLCSSSSWVLAGPEKGLGYILSDAGYDVWMGNFRGNRFSQKHKDLSFLSFTYWNFTWDEMGKYDLLAMISYLLRKTGVDKIFYIGHSQGTTAYFVLSNYHPEFTEKYIHTTVALAPVAHLDNIKSLGLKMLSKFVQTFVFNSVQTMLSLHNVEQSSSIITTIMDYVCEKVNFVKPICDNLLFTLGGYDEAQTNKTLLPIIWNHVPAGSSMKQLVHYAQIISAKRFQMYDYGIFSNLYYYYSIYPTEYDLSNCQVPVAMFYSSNDWISTPKDINTLYEKLPNSSKYYVNYKTFTHLDFVWAIDVKKLLYNDILKYMKTFL